MRRARRRVRVRITIPRARMASRLASRCGDRLTRRRRTRRNNGAKRGWYIRVVETTLPPVPLVSRRLVARLRLGSRLSRDATPSFPPRLFSPYSSFEPRVILRRARVVPVRQRSSPPRCLARARRRRHRVRFLLDVHRLLLTPLRVVVLSAFFGSLGVPRGVLERREDVVGHEGDEFVVGAKLRVREHLARVTRLGVHELDAKPCRGGSSPWRAWRRFGRSRWHRAWRRARRGSWTPPRARDSFAVWPRRGISSWSPRRRRSSQKLGALRHLALRVRGQRVQSLRGGGGKGSEG